MNSFHTAILVGTLVLTGHVLAGPGDNGGFGGGRPGNNDNDGRPGNNNGNGNGGFGGGRPGNNDNDGRPGNNNNNNNNNNNGNGNGGFGGGRPGNNDNDGRPGNNNNNNNNNGNNNGNGNGGFGGGRPNRCQEGTESVVNQMYYKCRNGDLKPFACATANGVKVEKGADFRDDYFRYVCREPQNDWFTLVAEGCVKNRVDVPVGQTTSDQSFWYTCTRDSQDSQLYLKISGCLGENGAKVGHNGLVTKGQFVFKCTVSPNGVRLEPHGCISEGKTYQIGSEFVKDSFGYVCVSTQNGISLKINACIHKNQRLNDGNTVNSDGFVYKCDINPNGARLNIVGCLDDKNAPHKLGETWYQGALPYQFVMECDKQPNGMVFKKLKQCYYNGRDGQGALDGNCVHRYGTTLVKCIQLANGSLRFEYTQNSSEFDLKKALQAGFRSC